MSKEFGCNVSKDIRYISIFKAVKVHTAVLYIVTPCSLVAASHGFTSTYCVNPEDGAAFLFPDYNAVSRLRNS